MDLKTVLRETETWPMEAQIQLAQKLWDRLEDRGCEPELTDDQKAALDRRLGADEPNPDVGSSWEGVKLRLWSGS